MINKQMIRNALFKIESIKSIWIKLSQWRNKFILKFNPKYVANRPYKHVFKKNINWDKPEDLIEKIQWLQLYTDTSLWTLCADKFLVRDFVEDKGCGDVLNELYGHWSNAGDINWSALPNSFVLKANHSCGDVLLVKNEKTLDIERTVHLLNKWMKTVYGYNSAQLHYLKIKPCIIAEKLLENNENSNKALVDYKIWCFHGVPEHIEVIFNRTSSSYSQSIYDIEWNNITDIALNKKESNNNGIDMPKPLSLNRMIEVAKRLSKDIPQVRVDFYDINNKAVFGEMTFTAGGYGDYTEEYNKYLGSKIDLSKVEKLPIINRL